MIISIHALCFIRSSRRQTLSPEPSTYRTMLRNYFTLLALATSIVVGLFTSGTEYDYVALLSLGVLRRFPKFGQKGNAGRGFHRLPSLNSPHPHLLQRRSLAHRTSSALVSSSLVPGYSTSFTFRDEGSLGKIVDEILVETSAVNEQPGSSQNRLPSTC